MSFVGLLSFSSHVFFVIFSPHWPDLMSCPMSASMWPNLSTLVMFLAWTVAPAMPSPVRLSRTWNKDEQCAEKYIFLHKRRHDLQWGKGYKTKLTTPLTPQCAAQMNSKRLFLLSSHSPFKLRKASFIIILTLNKKNRNRQILVGWT